MSTSNILPTSIFAVYSTNRFSEFLTLFDFDKNNKCRLTPNGKSYGSQVSNLRENSTQVCVPFCPPSITL